MRMLGRQNAERRARRPTKQHKHGGTLPKLTSVDTLTVRTGRDLATPDD